MTALILPPRGLRRLAVFMALVALAVIPAEADSPRQPEAPRSLKIDARPIPSFDVGDPSRVRFGSLEFIGGLELSSPDKVFGELSSLLLSPDGGKFLSVSDKGRWFRGRILYKDNKPVGIADAETAPILGSDGSPLAARGWYDTESLTDDGNGTLYVGIERVNQIVKFDYAKDGLLARGESIEIPEGIKSFPHNQGLETLVFVPRAAPKLGGTLIAISERALDAAKNTIGFLIGGQMPGQFTIRRTEDFDATDATLLPNGDMLLLERFFSPLRGIAMRIRRIALADFVPGALLDGPVLLQADMGYQIDNMEGIAVHRSPQGDTIVTLVSDDNFNPIQRNILLQFKLVEP